LYDVLYTNQSEFASRGESYLREAIGKLGVDVPRAVSDAQSDTVKAIVAADKQEGETLGFSGTPGFLVNGVLLQGTYPRSSFERIINRQLSQMPLTGR
jgi:protein-disulfide isomerase